MRAPVGPPRGSTTRPSPTPPRLTQTTAVALVHRVGEPAAETATARGWSCQGEHGQGEVTLVRDNVRAGLDGEARQPDQSRPRRRPPASARNIVGAGASCAKAHDRPPLSYSRSRQAPAGAPAPRPPRSVEPAVAHHGGAVERREWAPYSDGASDVLQQPQTVRVTTGLRGALTGLRPYGPADDLDSCASSEGRGRTRPGRLEGLAPAPVAAFRSQLLPASASLGSWARRGHAEDPGEPPLTLVGRPRAPPRRPAQRRPADSSSAGPIRLPAIFCHRSSAGTSSRPPPPRPSRRAPTRRGRARPCTLGSGAEARRAIAGEGRRQDELPHVAGPDERDTPSPSTTSTAIPRAGPPSEHSLIRMAGVGERNSTPLVPPGAD